jgi:hypothetical protein
MRNGKWLGTILLAFLAGYFVHLFSTYKSSKPDIVSCESLIVSSSSYSSIQASVQAEINYRVANSTEKSSTSTSIISSVKSASSTDAKQTAIKNDSIEVSDQNEKQLPKPFDELLKRMDSTLREKYEAYAANAGNPKDDWDMRMQSKITDFILSRPAATDIKIDSINCNSNMCEIRLQEQKRFLLMATFAELLQESWVINTSTGQFNFSDNNGYMLLVRK